MAKIPPYLHVFPPWCWVCSMFSIGIAPYQVQCNTPLLHIYPNFYAVEVFHANLVVFCRQGLRIFKVIADCGISRYNRCIGKQVSVLDIPAIK